jgi:hypothetical protein
MTLHFYWRPGRSVHATLQGIPVVLDGLSLSLSLSLFLFPSRSLCRWATHSDSLLVVNSYDSSSLFSALL